MQFAKTIVLLACFALAVLTAEQSYSQQGKPKQVTGGKAAAKKAAPAKQQGKTPAKRKKAKGRLPNNYGKIGLANEQRQQIYGIQVKYRPQLEELEKQIKALRAQRDAEIEAVLTDSQKQRLAELQEAAKKKRASRKKPKPAKTGKSAQ